MNGAGAGGDGRLLEGRAAIVSGIGPGLGRDTALALAREGARVALLSRSADRLSGLVGEIEGAGGEAVAIPTDVTRADDCEAAVETVLERWDRIDVLVNNAFVLGGTERFLDADLDDDWRSAFEVNLFGSLRMSQAVARSMRSTGGGSIVFVNTVSVRKADIQPEFAAYASSKGALRTATRYLAQELGPHGIRVNTVTPGRILGEALLGHLERLAAREGRSGDALRREIEAGLPLGHVVTPGEIADAVVFFASGLSRAITGVELDVNGGEFIPA